MPFPIPDENLQHELGARFGIVGGMDEVGRGSLAGPVCVGLVVPGSERAPEGIADSKVLTAKRRSALEPLITGWANAAATGWASPREIDQLGLTGALRLAGLRAIRDAEIQLRAASVPKLGVILLDGTHNWLAPPAQESILRIEEPAAIEQLPPVYTRAKADLTSVAVAAASIVAKVARDQYMEQLADPGYDWASNKGYGSAKHREALSRLGPGDEHRLTWNLLGKKN